MLYIIESFIASQFLVRFYNSSAFIYASTLVNPAEVAEAADGSIGGGKVSGAAI